MRFCTTWPSTVQDCVLRQQRALTLNGLCCTAQLKDSLGCSAYYTDRASPCCEDTANHLHWQSRARGGHLGSGQSTGSKWTATPACEHRICWAENKPYGTACKNCLFWLSAGHGSASVQAAKTRVSFWKGDPTHSKAARAASCPAHGQTCDCCSAPQAPASHLGHSECRAPLILQDI